MELIFYPCRVTACKIQNFEIFDLLVSDWLVNIFNFFTCSCKYEEFQLFQIYLINILLQGYRMQIYKFWILNFQKNLKKFKKFKIFKFKSETVIDEDEIWGYGKVWIFISFVEIFSGGAKLLYIFHAIWRRV